MKIKTCRCELHARCGVGKGAKRDVQGPGKAGACTHTRVTHPTRLLLTYAHQSAWVRTPTRYTQTSHWTKSTALRSLGGRGHVLLRLAAAAAPRQWGRLSPGCSTHTAISIQLVL